MREIKFRVWNKVLGEYINKDYHKKYYLNFDGVLCSFSDFGLVLPLDMKNYILEQYTGLVDKNGVEIYENDYLGHKHNVVEFINGAFVVAGDRLLCDMNKHLEVIGNIHNVIE